MLSGNCHVPVASAVALILVQPVILKALGDSKIIPLCLLPVVKFGQREEGGSQKEVLK